MEIIESTPLDSAVAPDGPASDGGEGPLGLAAFGASASGQEQAPSGAEVDAQLAADEAGRGFLPLLKEVLGKVRRIFDP